MPSRSESSDMAQSSKAYASVHEAAQSCTQHRPQSQPEWGADGQVHARSGPQRSGRSARSLRGPRVASRWPPSPCDSARPTVPRHRLLPARPSGPCPVRSALRDCRSYSACAAASFQGEEDANGAAALTCIHGRAASAGRLRPRGSSEPASGQQRARYPAASGPSAGSSSDASEATTNTTHTVNREKNR